MPRPSETRLNELEAPGTIDQELMYRVIDVLVAIGEARGVPPAQVALNWLLSKPCVDTVVVGARNEEQLRTNLGAAAWHRRLDLRAGVGARARRGAQGEWRLAPDRPRPLT